MHPSTKSSQFKELNILGPNLPRRNMIEKDFEKLNIKIIIYI